MTIDVLIPTRNAPESAWLCLTHFWAHSFWQAVASVVILDNCSTDERMGPILAMAGTREHHLVVRHDRNVGVWCSLNRGLALSRADLVLVITSDVLIGPATMPALLEAKRHTKHAFISPDCVTGLAHAPALGRVGGPVHLEPRYNGACWLMDWRRLREEVGWFDPRFYVAFGDTDYIERLRIAAAERQDPTLVPVFLAGLPVCHLDKQSRRADMTAAQDTDMELRDGARFREKWKDHPEVLARHPEGSRESYLAFKGRDLGGWEEARVK